LTHKKDLKILEFGQSVVDHTQAMLAYWDKDLICRFANLSYVEWFGKTKKEMINKITLPELLGPLYKLNLPHINAALRGEKQVFERIIGLPGGEMKNTIATYIPDKVNGRVKGFYVHVADISIVKSPDLETKFSKNQNLTSADTMGIAERIEKDLRDNILAGFPGIANLAKKFYLSESTIKRVFKKKYRQNLQEYFRNQQMRLAEEYLSGKQYNKKQLANMFGFSNPYNFLLSYNNYLNQKNTNQRLELLKQSNEEHYHSFIAGSPFAMALVNEKMKYVSASEAWRTEYKLLKGKETGEYCRNFLFSEKGKWEKLYKNCLRGHEYHGEEELLDMQKEIRWLQWDIRPWYNHNRVSGVLLFIQNITLQKLKDTESRKIFEILEKAGEIARIGIWKRNFNTNKSLWSKVTREILEVPYDFSSDLVTSLNFYEPGEGRKQIEKVLKNALEKGEAFDIESVITTAKGNRKPVRVIGYSDFKNGKCERLFGIILDLSSGDR